MWMYCDPDNYDLKPALAAHLGVATKHRRRRRHRRPAEPGRAHVCRRRATRWSPRSAPIRPSTSMSPALADGWSTCPMRTTARTSTGCSRRRGARTRAMVYLSNPDNPMGTWWEAGEIAASSRRCPRPRCRPRRGLWRDRPGMALPPLDVDAAERAPHAHLLQGLRARRHSLRLCRRRAAGDPRLREDPQSLWRQPHGAGRRRGGARRPGLSRRSEAQGRGRPAAHREDRGDNGLSPIASATNFVTIDCGGDGAFALK